MLIDSHCHLNYPGLVEDEAGVLARARAAGVTGFVNISTRRDEWEAVVGAAERHPDVWASVGIHPHEGIGETGLDYYYDKSDREQQRRGFRVHCAAARDTGLPLIVHSRDAEADTIAILEEELGQGAFPILFHCFTGSQWLADEALRLGALISLSGIVTFRNARELQAVAATIPGDRLLVETDAPFLAPVPVRGRTCEPAFVAHTAGFLAGLRGESTEELARRTAGNTQRLFRKMAA
jgi:TatD DNase family protein